MDKEKGTLKNDAQNKNEGHKKSSDKNNEGHKNDELKELVKSLISEELAVAVINIAPRPFYILRLLYLQFVIIKIFLTFYNLEKKDSLDENCGSYAKQHNNNYDS